MADEYFQWQEPPRQRARLAYFEIAKVWPEAAAVRQGGLPTRSHHIEADAA
jgi:hypothetical protein